MNYRFSTQQWFLIGLLLRLIVMPFTMHGDMYFVYKYPHYFSHGEWDIYGKGIYYPPANVIFFATVQFIYRIIFPGFENFTHMLAYTNTDMYESEHIFLSHFLMKLPYLVFDIFLINICWRMILDKNNKKYLMIFWAVNPVIIYGTFMVGQMGLIPTFFVVLACYFSLKKGKESFACLSLAAGTLFKLFPIIFLPMVLCISSRNIKDAFRLSLYCLLPILFFYGIFYLISGPSVFNNFRLVDDQFFQDISLSQNFGNVLLKLCQAFVYFFVCYHILQLRPDRLNYLVLIQCFLAVYLAFYWVHIIAATHRYVWFIPFMILYIQKYPKWKKPFYLLMVVIFLAGLRSRGSFMGIFGPLNPELFFSIPSLKDITWHLFGPTYDIIAESLFKVITAIMALLLLKNIYSTAHEKFK